MLPSSPACAILPAYSETTPETQNGRSTVYISATRIETVQFNFQPRENFKNVDQNERCWGGSVVTFTRSCNFQPRKSCISNRLTNLPLETERKRLYGKADTGESVRLEKFFARARNRRNRRFAERQGKDKGRASKKMEFLWRYSRYRAGEKSGCQSPLIPFLPPFLEFPFSSPLQNSLSSSYF